MWHILKFYQIDTESSFIYLIHYRKWTVLSMYHYCDYQSYHIILTTCRHTYIKTIVDVCTLYESQNYANKTDHFRLRHVRAQWNRCANTNTFQAHVLTLRIGREGYEGWHVMTSRHASIIKTYGPDKRAYQFNGNPLDGFAHARTHAHLYVCDSDTLAL